MNIRNVTFAFAAAAILLAAAGGIYFVASGGFERAELIYHGNGGLNNGKEEAVTYEHIVWGVDFQKAGYVLEGWNTAADGSGTSYKIGDYLSYDKDVHIYAQWANVAEYNAVYVDSYKDESDIKFTLNLYSGTESVELNRFTYVLTKEDTVYLTLETSYTDWDITTDGTKGFNALREDVITGSYYCLNIAVAGTTGLYVDPNGNMQIGLNGNTELNIYMFMIDSNVYLTE